MSVAVQAVDQITDELVEAAGHLLAQLSSATGRNQDPPVKPAVHIRACQQEDAKQLKRQGRAQPQRWQRQQQGNSTFLIAVAVPDGVPVGMGEILWDGCQAPEMRRRYPSCPELNGLEVWPAELRSHGIGTAIVHTAEDLARQRGHHQLGLGVDDHNHRAAALYLRLGYQETGCHYLDRYHYIDHDGVRHEVADPARFLVKPL